jgi:hypothetical protein
MNEEHWPGGVLFVSAFPMLSETPALRHLEFTHSAPLSLASPAELSSISAAVAEARSYRQRWHTIR